MENIYGILINIKGLVFIFLVPIVWFVVLMAEWQLKRGMGIKNNN
jgi:hypothetical protein